MMLLIGYSSYSILIIRSNANPPIDEGNPENALSLTSYLERDQYGDWPIVKGQNYNQKYPFVQPTGIENVGANYMKDEKAGKYKQIGDKKEYTYPETTFFPRMWSDQKAAGYNNWRKSHGKNPKSKIKFSENLHFFFDYQIGWSYMRYFMWNFAGRQNDVRNMDGNSVYGNWESGVGYSDEGLPKHLKDNKGKNHYYFLPLIIGLIGMFFHFKKQKTDALSVLLFFLFTGVLIIVYLNVPPDQPRERDYAYVGSFYAFAIWIGMGVLAIFDKIKGKLNGNTAAILATSICLLAAPILMAKENWDDHDRSGKYTALEIARNYLKSCDTNAVLFTNGDNDTFPLWYIQEVEEFRTDIKIVNLSLLGMDWYIDQMKRATYEAPPIPSALSLKDYRGSKNNQVAIDRKRKKYLLITDAIKLIKEGKPCPQNIKLLVDSSNLSHLNIPEEFKSNIVTEIKFTIKGQSITKSDLLLLDIIANFNWKQAIYFSGGGSVSKFKGLENFLHPFGAVYQLLPYSMQTGIDTEKMDQLLIGENAYNYGGINDSEVYIDHTTKISLYTFRNSYYYLSSIYLRKGENDKAIKIADKYFEEFEWSSGLLDPVSINIAAVYAQTGEIEKGEIITEMLQENTLQLNYLKTQQLSGEAQRLLEETGKNIKKLTRFKEILATKKESNKERKKNLSDYGKEETNSEREIKEIREKIQLQVGDSAITTKSGMSISVINKGNGDIYPQANSTVKCHYTGKLEEGRVFDSSVQRGEPATFGLNQVIPGWTEALQLMKVGDKWEVTIPGNLAYGKNGMPQAGIGPNATLIFEIELLEIL
jgi:FKBP-type peptidyl-prolyl cis-trans isomerase